MIVVFTPAGGEPEHYDASTLRVSEAGIVQRTVDMKWQEIREGLERDDLDAMRGIVWVLKRRSNPSLRFGDFDPGVDEMTSRMDQREVAAYVDNAFAACESDENLTQEMVANLLRDRLPDVAADPEHARRLIEARVQVPKADEDQDDEDAQEPTPAAPSSPSPTSTGPETPTSDSSPTSSTSLPEMSTA